jgi:hypothetical protein
MASHNRQARRNRRAGTVTGWHNSQLFRETVQEVRTATNQNGIPWEVRHMTRHAASGGVNPQTGREGNVHGGCYVNADGRLVNREPVRIEGGRVIVKRPSRPKPIKKDQITDGFVGKAYRAADTLNVFTRTVTPVRIVHGRKAKAAAKAIAKARRKLFRAAALAGRQEARAIERIRKAGLKAETRAKIEAARKAAGPRPVKQSVRPKTIGTLRLKANEIKTDLSAGILALEDL